VNVVPIGILRSPYVNKYDAPRQPGVDERIDLAHIDLEPHHNFEQALQDLDGFERIWILSWFHRADAWKPKVLPPRSAVKRGVFATRSPHRPNPIGLSVARLVVVRGLRITIAETDLLDGTPILDIKPYLSYADAFEGSKAGWVDDAALQPSYSVVFDPGVITLLERDQSLKAHVERVLCTDPYPHPYRRTEACDDGTYILSVRTTRIHYTISSTTVMVHRIVVL
jgi:tRNA-Thr(GGU) m(6)t(6)A37 methyltransferase TsaA